MNDAFEDWYGQYPKPGISITFGMVQHAWFAATERAAKIVEESAAKLHEMGSRDFDRGFIESAAALNRAAKEIKENDK